MGFLLATSLPFAFWLIGSRHVLRPLVVAVVALLGAGLVFSFARGAMLALAAGAVWLIVVERRHVRLLLVGALAVGLAAVFVVHSSSSQVSSGLRLKQHVAAQNVSIRLQVWDAAANLAADHPLLGIGPGNFRDVYYQATGRPPGSLPRLAVVHNAYLDIAAELGIGALLLFLAYLAFAFTRLADCVRAAVGPPGFASIVRTSLVVSCVGALTLSEQYFPQFWLFGGLASALWAERRRAARAAAAVVAEVVPAAQGAALARPYDHDVSERRVEERERRASAQFEAITAQQERLTRRLEDLRAREERVEHGLAELQRGARANADAEASLRERSRSLAERERELAGLEQEAALRSTTLAAEVQELVARRRRVAARELELAELTRGLAENEREVERGRLELRRDEAELASRRRAVEAARAEVADRERAVRKREAEVAAEAIELEARRRLYGGPGYEPGGLGRR
jgi:hypothetical protein